MAKRDAETAECADVTAARAVVRCARHRSESQLQGACLAVFRAYGILCWPMQRERAWKRQTHIGFRGLPDIGGVLPGGRALFVEIKRPGQSASPYQVGAMRMLAKQGAFVCLVRDIQEAEQAAKEATR